MNANSELQQQFKLKWAHDIRLILKNTKQWVVLDYMMFEKKKNNENEKIQKAYTTSCEGIKNRILETGPITHASEVRAVSSREKVGSCSAEHAVLLLNSLKKSDRGNHWRSSSLQLQLFFKNGYFQDAPRTVLKLCKWGGLKSQSMETLWTEYHS